MRKYIGEKSFKIVRDRNNERNEYYNVQMYTVRHKVSPQIIHKFPPEIFVTRLGKLR